MSRQERINAYIKEDAYAKSLGATIEAIEPGYSRVSLVVTAEMCNFHGTTHGGLIFSLGDIAFAAAGNARGQTAVALNVSVSFMRAAQVGDKLTAVAQEKDLNGPIGLYEIVVTDQHNQRIAELQAMIYRKREWFVEEAPH